MHASACSSWLEVCRIWCCAGSMHCSAAAASANSSMASTASVSCLTSVVIATAALERDRADALAGRLLPRAPAAAAVAAAVFAGAFFDDFLAVGRTSAGCGCLTGKGRFLPLCWARLLERVSCECFKPVCHASSCVGMGHQPNEKQSRRSGSC